MLSKVLFTIQDNPLDTCLEVDLNTCDRFIDEDCEYYGDVLLKTPTGSIADARHCQELCEKFASAGCEYWTFQQDSCSLLTSGERSCTTLGGPKTPEINECIGMIDDYLDKSSVPHEKYT